MAGRAGRLRVKDFVHDAPATRVVFGVGALSAVPDEIVRLGGERVFLIGDRAAKDYSDQLAAALGTRLADRVDDVVMHVPAEASAVATARATESGTDLLVALGGGSATGLAKAVARAASLPILAIPTTYAGSEMTPIWGQTEGNRKITGRDPRVLPRTVVYDPELTVGLPVDVSAASGMNALAHCVEGLYSSAASPVTAVLAEDGIRALADALPRVVTNPADLDARGDALYGAWMAGWVLGTSGMGVHHKVCHVLGGAFDLPHAEVHSAVLPYATAFNAPFAAEAMTRVARALRTDDPAGGLWDLASTIGAPTSLATVGFRRADADPVAAIVADEASDNPRPVTMEGVLELLLAANDGHRPDTTTTFDPEGTS
ncbi:MAG: maleylacetate reductase [Jiangellaceae bacterium]